MTHDTAVNNSPRETAAQICGLGRIQGLSPLAMQLRLLLGCERRVGVVYAYPGASVFAKALGVRIGSIRRAEQQMAGAGLINFTFVTEERRLHRQFTLLEIPLNAEADLDKVFGSAPQIIEAQPQESEPVTLPAVDESSAPDSQAQSPARTQTPREPKGKGLTPDQVAMICRNATTMGIYILYGKGAVVPEIMDNPCREPAEYERFFAELRSRGITCDPAKNWHVAGFDYRHPEFVCAQWDCPKWGAYYWNEISKLRCDLGMPLTLPVYPKLYGVFKNLLKRVPAAMIIRCVCDLAIDYAVVKMLLGPGFKSFNLDELTLANSGVFGVLSTLPDINSDERRELRDKAQTLANT